jgi:general secretion pathway protein H
MRPGIRPSLWSVRAFTLIELLVVLVVIGVAAGLVYVNLGGDHARAVEREAKRLAGALEHAALVAQWTGETLGVSADGRSYRFWRRSVSDRWSAVADDDVLAPHTLGIDLTVSAATYAGAPVTAGAILPFRPTGRNEPFVLVLTSPGGAITIAADPLNRVHVAPPGRGLRDSAL